jgi:hypothetical protein
MYCTAASFIPKDMGKYKNTSETMKTTLVKVVL